MIDTLYDVPCKIQHIPSIQDIRKFSNIMKFYFEEFGGLIMMGGDLDASSKGVAGIHIVDNDAYLLVVVSCCVVALMKNPKIETEIANKNIQFADQIKLDSTSTNQWASLSRLLNWKFFAVLFWKKQKN